MQPTRVSVAMRLRRAALAAMGTSNCISPHVTPGRFVTVWCMWTSKPHTCRACPRAHSYVHASPWVRTHHVTNQPTSTRHTLPPALPSRARTHAHMHASTLSCTHTHRHRHMNTCALAHACTQGLQGCKDPSYPSASGASQSTSDSPVGSSIGKHDTRVP